MPAFLEAGDLVVINTSAVVPAAVTAWTDDDTKLIVHLSTRLDDGRWVVELRRIDGRTTRRWDGPVPHRSHAADGRDDHTRHPVPRQHATVGRPSCICRSRCFTWLAVHGQPIRYGYVERPWPIATYQNVYATEPGSAEMPSAGRPFTPEVITRLVAKGVGVSPLVLHTGVASLEATELPYPERLRVPASTAESRQRHASQRRPGDRGRHDRRSRAREQLVEATASCTPIDGWTDLVITPERGVRVVDGLLTGWHEPEASHLLMLEAVAGRSLLEKSYAASLQEGYLWHEFGDMHLILP